MEPPYAVLTAELVTHLAELPGPKRVVLETGTWSNFVVRQRKSLGVEVVPVDPLRSHRLLEVMRSAKADRLDALSLAQLPAEGQADRLAVWVPDQVTYELRELSRGREWLAAFLVRQPAWVQAALRAQWRVLLLEAAALQGLEHTLRQVAREEPRVAQVQTLIGCGPVTAVAEVGEVRRFPNAAHLRSYAGLVPQVRQSGARCWIGRCPPPGQPAAARRPGAGRATPGQQPAAGRHASEAALPPLLAQTWTPPGQSRRRP